MASRNPSDQEIALENLPKAKVNRESLRAAFSLVRYVRPYRLRFFAGLGTLFVSASCGLAFPLLAGALIEAGTVVELGTHDELAARPDGLYQRLSSLQFAENNPAKPEADFRPSVRSA